MARFWLVFVLIGFLAAGAAKADDTGEYLYEYFKELNQPPDTEVYYIPYPEYYYNPCVGCSPWMLENSYPASESRMPLTGPTGRIGTPANTPLLERE